MGKSFSGSISEMTWQNGDYVSTDEIKTPHNTNLLGLTLGDVLKKEYRIRRSWEKTNPLVMKDFEKVQRLIFEVKGFDGIPLKKIW